MIHREDVLVVEDEPLIAEMLSCLLEEEGYRVTRASSGAEAIDVAVSAASPFSYLVSDINLGGTLDGFDVASAVAARAPDAKTILLTGDSARSHQSRALENTLILEKPCLPHELLRALRGGSD